MDEEEIDFMELFTKYAEDISERMQKRGCLTNFEADNLRDAIEGDGLHVDFLGVPVITTAVLMFHDEKNRQIHVKVIDNIGIRSFTFNLKQGIEKSIGTVKDEKESKS